MAEKVNKLVEEIGKLPVIELAQLVKQLEETFGVSAAMPVAAPAAVNAEASPVDEKTEYKVTLKSIGDKKINIIKAVRAVTTLGLKEAKDMVDSVPSVLAESASKDDAEKMKKELEAAGASVELG